MKSAEYLRLQHDLLRTQLILEVVSKKAGIVLSVEELALINSQATQMQKERN